MDKTCGRPDGCSDDEDDVDPRIQVSLHTSIIEAYLSLRLRSYTPSGTHEQRSAMPGV